MEQEDYITHLESLNNQTIASNIIFKAEINDVYECVQDLKSNPESFFPDSIDFYMRHLSELLNNAIESAKKLDKKLKFISRKCKAALHKENTTYVSHYDFCINNPKYDPIKILEIITSDNEDVMDTCVADELGNRFVNEQQLKQLIEEKHLDAM